MKEPRRHTLVVDSLANSGDGVGRIDGRVVFIPFSCPGDLVEIEITQAKKSFLKGRLIRVITPGADRITPHCQYFGKCGGCDWQHLPYHRQTEWKVSHLQETLKRIGKIDAADVYSPIVSSPAPLHYRNRIQLTVRNSKFHYHAKASDRLIAIEQCPIASEAINTFLKTPDARGLKDGKWEVAEVDGAVDVFKVSKSGVSDMGFRQVHFALNQQMVQKTVDFITQEGVRSVLDLYCGQGNWARSIHSAAPETLCSGVDISPINIKKAKAYESENLRFHLADAKKFFQQHPLAAELVVIDPPRAGCEQGLLRDLARSKARYINYVSCHPATLARDLRILTDEDWTLIEVAPFDMFPQTSHLETWCMLRSAR